MLCNNCQKTNDIDARFCNFCGESLQNDTASIRQDEKVQKTDSRASDVGWQMNVSNETDSEPETIDDKKIPLKGVEENSSKEPRTKTKFRFFKKINIKSIIGSIKKGSTPFQIFFLLVFLCSIWIYIEERGRSKGIVVIILCWLAYWITYWIYRSSLRKKTKKNFLQGEVRGFKERNETTPLRIGSPASSITIWNFRLERYENGQQLKPIPVEMRGQKFVGFINEGDTVELLSSWQGKLHETKEVFNITNGANVKATGDGTSTDYQIYSLIVIIIIIVIIVTIINAAK